jgi:hypothetical protein
VQVTVGYEKASWIPLVLGGSIWKYKDDGSNQGSGTNWSLLSFNDNTWASGAAELGYGDLPDGRPESTVICCSNAATKSITYYFRRPFTVPSDTVITNLTFRLVRDDGAVVWLNGREMYRSNMPSTAITFSTLASSAVGNADESTFFVTSLPVTNVVSGTNLLAVEIHQSDTTSSDVSFNLELSGDGYLFDPAPPVLKAVLTNAQIQIAWPASSTGYQLYGCLDLAGPVWQPVGGAPTIINGFNVMTLPATNATTFYRLQKP